MALSAFSDFYPDKFLNFPLLHSKLHCNCKCYPSLFDARLLNSRLCIQLCRSEVNAVESRILMFLSTLILKFFTSFTLSEKCIQSSSEG